MSNTPETITGNTPHTHFPSSYKNSISALDEGFFSELGMDTQNYKNKKDLDTVLRSRSERLKGVAYQEVSQDTKFVNFYEQKAVSPYIPAFGKGPWICTTEGGIVYDAGGYGMLGFGHNDEDILEVLSCEQVMANILTPNLSQKIFSDEVDKHIPLYDGILALNSGSETNELAFRIADAYFKTHHSDEKPVIVILSGSFHGRTYLSGQASDSCREKYEKYLWSYGKFFDMYRIKVNDTAHAIEVFDTIRTNKQCPMLTLMEPVMGEGNPGVMITPEFYHVIREETKKLNSLLHIDSVQAGLRTTGELSVTTYDGFNITRDTMPDMEVFSKTINGGQYPFSVLAIKTRDLYKYGIYGNTMTGNPRGLDVGTCVLKKMTPDVKKNIVNSGLKLKSKLFDLKTEFPEIVSDVTGTGLLVAIHLNARYNVFDLEKKVRMSGLNLIHGGKNGLRMTPWFHIDDMEIELIYRILRCTFRDEIMNASHD